MTADLNVITVPEDTPPETVNELVADGWIVRMVNQTDHTQSHSDSSRLSVSSEVKSPRPES